MAKRKVNKVKGTRARLDSFDRIPAKTNPVERVALHFIIASAISTSKGTTKIKMNGGI